MGSSIGYEDFKRLVTALFARYPTAVLSEATVPAWWAELKDYQAGALFEAFKKAPRGNSKYCPSCETVREHAAAWRPPTPQADLSRPALPEPEPELPPELAAIRQRQKRGEITAQQATREFLHWVGERLP